MTNVMFCCLWDGWLCDVFPADVVHTCVFFVVADGSTVRVRIVIDIERQSILMRYTLQIKLNEHENRYNMYNRCIMYSAYT